MSVLLPAVLTESNLITSCLYPANYCSLIKNTHKGIRGGG